MNLFECDANKCAKCDIPVEIGAARLVCTASIWLRIQQQFMFDGSVRFFFLFQQYGDITLGVVVFCNCVFNEMNRFLVGVSLYIFDMCLCVYVYVRACQLWDKRAFVMFPIFSALSLDLSLYSQVYFCSLLMFVQNKISMFRNEVDIIVLAKHEWRTYHKKILKFNRFLLVLLLLFFIISFFFYRIDKILNWPTSTSANRNERREKKHTSNRITLLTHTFQ